MSLGLCFWIIMLLWLLLGLWHSWPQPWLLGGNLMLFILLLLLGWHSFGAPIRG